MECDLVKQPKSISAKQFSSLKSDGNQNLLFMCLHVL